MARAFIPPEECPVCGAAVPKGAKACPECGADERSGWDEETTRYDDLDLPSTAFDESDGPAPHRGSRLWIGITAVVVAAGLLIFLLSPR